MQGPMINDFTAVPESGSFKVPAGSKEQPEQPFGEVLGTEMSEKTSAIEPEKSAEPFFMASLFDQSASFVAPSENTELVAAAERVQELIGSWLQTQTDNAQLESQATLQMSDQPALEEVLSVALEILDQVESTEQQAEMAIKAEVDLSQQILGKEEIEELKQLMSMMMQNDEVRASLQNAPMISELQQQVEKTALLAGEQGNIKAAQLAGEQGNIKAEQQKVQVETANPTAIMAGADDAETFQTDAKAGLQEEQIAKMLKPRHEQPMLHEQKMAKAQNVPEQQAEVAPAFDGELDAMTELPVETVKPGMQTLGSHAQVQPGTQVSSVPRLDPSIATAAPKMMQLPSGQQLAETQLVDQVVTHLAGSSDGESGRMRLRLHPAELGSLRLDLIVEGDRLRAHLQAQTQQVQEVLDRHLPQLREALQQQGLKIDEFRVDVQTGQDQANEQKFAWQEQQQGRSPQSPWLADDWQQQDLEIPLQQLMQQANGSISLRV